MDEKWELAEIALKTSLVKEFHGYFSLSCEDVSLKGVLFYPQQWSPAFKFQ